MQLKTDIKQFHKIAQPDSDSGSIGLLEYLDKFANAILSLINEAVAATMFAVANFFVKINKEHKNWKTEEIKQTNEPLCGRYKGNGH